MIDPTEILLGVSFGFAFGSAVAVAIGCCSLAATYAFDVTIPGSVAGVVAVTATAILASLAGALETTALEPSRHATAAGITVVLAAYASDRGASLASVFPRRTARPTVRERTLAATAAESIDAAGQVAIRSSGEIRDLEGCPSLDRTRRSDLENGVWRLPADLPLVELESRLETRLRSRYALETVSVSIDERGRATIAAGRSRTTVSRDVPDGHCAVTVRTTVPAGLAVGDDVEVTTAAETVSGTVLETTVIPSTDVRGSETAVRPSRRHRSRGGEGFVTVVVPTCDAGALLASERAGVVVRPTGTSHVHDAITLLERAGVEIRTRTVTDALVDRLEDCEATLLAVRAGRESTRERLLTAPDVDDLEIGSTVILAERGPDAISRDARESIVEVDRT